MKWGFYGNDGEGLWFLNAVEGKLVHEYRRSNNEHYARENLVDPKVASE